MTTTDEDPTEPGTTRCWGVTENGGFVEVVVASHLLDELDNRWPLLGMERRLERPTYPELPEGRLGLGEDGLYVPGDGTPPGLHPNEDAWGLMEQTLTIVAVLGMTHLVAIHSAVIAFNGSVLLVPAVSEGGKSTLTRAAAAAGAAVLSDEYALVDPTTGLVTGWHRPIRIRTVGGGQERIDLARPSDPLPVGLVAAITYEPGATSSWTDISGSAATLELLANTVCARTRPDASLDAALAIARSARAVKGVRGEADQAVAELLRMLEEPRPPQG